MDMKHSEIGIVTEIDVGQIDMDSSEGKEVISAKVIDSLAERKLCRKLDFSILPFIALMYLFNGLDRGNISNAKTDGIEADLGMKDSQWNILLSIFYIPFVLAAFPLMFIIKKYGAANVIPCLMFGFGSFTLISVSVTTFGGLMATRFMLGICESAFFPGIIYYLTTFYRRDELGRRLSVFYAAANIANAFSGLLAFGVFQIDGALHGWQYLFIIEGTCTVAFSVVAYFFLPRSPATAKFLTAEERELAIFRIQNDSSHIVGESVSFKDAMKVFLHPVAVGWLFTELCLGVPLGSINSWFPQIIQNLGKGTVQTNLYTVAPNISGAVCLIILGFASDLTRIRSVFIMVALGLTLIGFVVFGAIDIKGNPGVAYFSCFLMTAGSSASSVLTSTWYNNNTPAENRRAVFSGVGVPLANAASLISANIFLPKDAPKYIPALGITAAFGGTGILTVGCILSYMIFDNRRRNKTQGVNWSYRDVSTAIMGDGPKNPSYRWMY